MTNIHRCVQWILYIYPASQPSQPHILHIIIYVRTHTHTHSHRHKHIIHHIFYLFFWILSIKCGGTILYTFSFMRIRKLWTCMVVESPHLYGCSNSQRVGYVGIVAGSGCVWMCVLYHTAFMLSSLSYVPTPRGITISMPKYWWKSKVDGKMVSGTTLCSKYDMLYALLTAI